MSQRKRSFFDIPDEPSNVDPDDKYNLPRRKIRHRRVSVEPGTILAQTDDGLTYRRRLTKICVKPVAVELMSSDGLQLNDDRSESLQCLSPTKEFLQNRTPVTLQAAPTFMEQRAMNNVVETVTDNFKKTKAGKRRFALIQQSAMDETASSNGTPLKVSSPSSKGEIEPMEERATSEVAAKKPKKPAASRGSKKTKQAPISFPEYPETSDWIPALGNSQGMTAELLLSGFLKQLTSFESSKVLSTYSGEEFAFLRERIDAMVNGFIVKSNEQIVKRLDEIGPFKKPKIRPNPANDALRVKEISWKHVIAMTRSERADWDALASRPIDLCSAEVTEEPDMDSLIESSVAKEALRPIEYQEAFLKAFTSVSVKADASLKAAHASSMAFSHAHAVQDEVCQSISKRALEPLQPIVELQTLIQNIITSG